MRRVRSSGRAAYIILALVWGTNFYFMAIAAPVLTPWQTTLLRVVAGLIPVVVFAMIMRSFAWWHLKHLHHFLVMSVLATGLYYLLFAAGVARLDSGIAAALSGSIPLFALLAAVVVLRIEHFSAPKISAVVIGAGGVFVLARPWNAGDVDPVGMGLMLLGSACLGASFAYARRFISPLGIPASASASYQMAIAAIWLLPLTDLTGLTVDIQEPQVVAAVALGLGVAGTGFAFVLYYVVVSTLGAVVASTVTYLPPLVALVIGILFLNEPVVPTSFLAVGMILTAAVVSQLRPRVGREYRREGRRRRRGQPAVRRRSL